MNTTNDTPRLGVDIGRVIIHGDGGGSGRGDTSFVGGSEEDALATPAIDGAFASLERLCRFFSGSVWLVSKCGKRVEARSRRWLDHHGFFEATGIPRSHLVFCRERWMKAPICAELGIGWFVDDRADVLAPMAGTVAHRFLFGASVTDLAGVVPAPTWAAAEAAIAATLRETLRGSRGTEAARAR
jgi:hypothetical protein